MARRLIGLTAPVVTDDYKPLPGHPGQRFLPTSVFIPQSRSLRFRIKAKPGAPAAEVAPEETPADDDGGSK